MTTQEAKCAKGSGAAFDLAAAQYDASFTASVTGSLQRHAVWKYLEKQPFLERPCRILELNCGTGEDALWLARHGHDVVATDASAAMLAVAASKQEDLSGHITFRSLDVLQRDWNLSTEPFDLVFSNFAGLNCVDPEQLSGLLLRVASALKSGGRFIVVLFGRHCLVETGYFLLKFEWKKAFRRASESATYARVEDGTVPVWYHRISDMSAGPAPFVLKRKQPVGLFLPPSFLKSQFPRGSHRAKLAAALESVFGDIQAFAQLGDHILLDFERA
jgi:ubiquinone/menaquinone biosynthesis C-methylase UbiE